MFRLVRLSLNLLTVILLGEVGRRLQDVLDERGVNLLHGQILDAVCVPVHVVPDALKRGSMCHNCSKSTDTKGSRLLEPA